MLFVFVVEFSTKTPSQKVDKTYFEKLCRREVGDPYIYPSFSAVNHRDNRGGE
jgi:hypothetical protein